MFATGTIINTIAVLIGGFIGVLFRKGLQKRFQDTLMSATGICVFFMGLAGTLQEMLLFEDGKLTSTGSITLVISLSLGAILGEWINLEYRTEQFGRWLKKKSGSDESAFIEGFVTTSLTICVGAMAVLGPINDGLYGDYSILLMKSILDAIIVVVFAASYGKGCTFSAIPIFLMEGSITVLARFIAPVITDSALSNLSLVGSALISCVGINLIFGKKVKVANLLPSLIVAVIYTVLFL